MDIDTSGIVIIRRDIKEWIKKARIAVGKNIKIIGYLIDAVFIATLFCCVLALFSSMGAGSTIWDMSFHFASGAIATTCVLIACVVIHLIAIVHTRTWVIIASGTTTAFLFVLTVTFLLVPTEVTRSMIHVPMTTAIRGYQSSDFAKAFIDDIHKNFHCCGLDSADGKSFVPFRLISNKFVGEQVPQSCCKPREPFVPVWLLSSVLEERQKFNADHPCLEIPQVIENDHMNSQNKVTTATQNELTTATQNKVTTVPQNKMTTAPQNEVTTATQNKVTTAPQNKVTTVPAKIPIENNKPVASETAPATTVTDAPAPVTEQATDRTNAEPETNETETKPQIQRSKREAPKPTKPKKVATKKPSPGDDKDISLENTAYFDCEKNATRDTSYTIGCYRNAARFFGYYQSSFLAAFSFVLIFELVSLAYSVVFCMATFQKWAEGGSVKEVDPENPNPPEEEEDDGEEE